MHVKCVVYNAKLINGIYFVVAFIAVIVKVILTPHSRQYCVSNRKVNYFPQRALHSVLYVALTFRNPFRLSLSMWHRSCVCRHRNFHNVLYWENFGKFLSSDL